MQNSFIFSELQDHIAGHESEMGNSKSNLFDNDITSEFVRSFETTLEKKKLASAVKQGIEKFIEEEVDNSEEV